MKVREDKKQTKPNRPNKSHSKVGRDSKGNDKKDGVRPRSWMELDGKELNFRSILKEVELLGSSDMTWKERKDLENQKIVSLGGKAPKKQRLPLSVARPMMKNQKERERKKLQEELLCGHYGESMTTKSVKQQPEKRRPEDMVLKSSERFSNGVLHVKHLLKSDAGTPKDEHGPPMAIKGKTKMNKKGGKKNHGKKKGGGKKH